MNRYTKKIEKIIKSTGEKTQATCKEAKIKTNIHKDTDRRYSKKMNKNYKQTL